MWELADDGSHGCGECGKARLSVCNRDPGKEAWLVAVPGGAGGREDQPDQAMTERDHSLRATTPRPRPQQEEQATNEPTLTLDGFGEHCWVLFFFSFSVVVGETDGGWVLAEAGREGRFFWRRKPENGHRRSYSKMRHDERRQRRVVKCKVQFRFFCD